MKRILSIRISSAVMLFFLVLSPGFAQAYQDLMKKSIANQNQIKTMLGQGTMIVRMKDSDGNILTETITSLSIYLKQPSMCKLIIEDPIKSIIVQNKNLLSMQMGESDRVIKQKVDELNNLITKYFQMSEEEIIESEIVESSETLYEGDNTIYKFRLKKPEGESYSVEGFPISFSIEAIEKYFNPNGLIVKSAIISEGKEIVYTEIEYVNKNGIFVIKSILTTSFMNEMIIENKIEYNALSINTVIQDKEFEL